MVVNTPKGTLCLMNPASQHGSQHTEALCLMNPSSQHGSKHAEGNPLLQGVWADQKGVLLKVNKRRFAFRLRETAPGSAPFGIDIYIYLLGYVYISTYMLIDTYAHNRPRTNPVAPTSGNLAVLGAMFLLSMLQPGTK